MKCAAYELPFEEGERFQGVEDTPELLGYLRDENILRQVAGKYYWMAEEFPQAGINLRSATDQNFLIVDITDPKKHRVIGEMDRFTVPMLLHQYAIYMHEGTQYQVEELDFDDKKAYIRRVDVGYYTDADLTTSLKVLDEFEREPDGPLSRSRGEVLTSSIVTVFKKIAFDTHENLGWGPVTLPELEMQTTATWWTLPEGLEAVYEREPLKNALIGLSHLLRHIAPMYLMCAPQDISVVYHVKDTFTGGPTIYLYDSVPGGIGLSDRVFEMHRELFAHARELLLACPCADGCPSCVGATAGPGAKGTLVSLLERLLDNG
jgi:DEAD/DEAH box helicase domain-containing protein